MSQTSEYTPEQLERFWKNVKKSNYCWVWQGSLDLTCGIGRFYMGPHRKAAHRVAWAVKNGPLAAGERLFTRCDTVGCVRPEHYDLQRGKKVKQYGGGPPEMTPPGEGQDPAVEGGPEATDPVVKEVDPRVDFLPPLDAKEHRRLLNVVAAAVLDVRKLVISTDAASAERLGTLGSSLVSVSQATQEALELCLAQGARIAELQAEVAEMRVAEVPAPIEAVEPPEPPTAAESGERVVPDGAPSLGQLLMSAFRSLVEDSPPVERMLPEDWEALDKSYDHALSVAGGDQSTATKLYQEWLQGFNDAAPLEPAQRSPEKFYEQLMAGHLSAAAARLRHLPAGGLAAQAESKK